MTTLTFTPNKCWQIKNVKDFLELYMKIIYFMMKASTWLNYAEYREKNVILWTSSSFLPFLCLISSDIFRQL